RRVVDGAAATAAALVLRDDVPTDFPRHVVQGEAATIAAVARAVVVVDVVVRDVEVLGEIGVAYNPLRIARDLEAVDGGTLTGFRSRFVRDEEEGARSVALRLRHVDRRV